MESHGFTQALVAQRIRASDYGSEGREFESLQARLKTADQAVFFCFGTSPLRTVSYD